MKIWLTRIALALMICPYTGFHKAQAQQSAEAPLTNTSIIKLVRAGFKEKTVVAIIRTRPAQFDLTPDRLIELKKSGVSENIILVMLMQDEVTPMAGDDWSDDPFFDDSSKSSRAKSGSKPGDTGIDIFGSSGGTRGQTRSRAGNGSNDGETLTTGSATVRIVRPPAEAGGAPPKLEKTPTLTNEEIVQLVEAGFSEGTIIRRIEHSPAEFDLTPPKLAELRRRRVSAPVIEAMRAAMGDDAASSTTPSNATPEK